MGTNGNFSLTEIETYGYNVDTKKIHWNEVQLGATFEVSQLLLWE